MGPQQQTYELRAESFNVGRANSCRKNNNLVPQRIDQTIKLTEKYFSKNKIIGMIPKRDGGSLQRDLPK